MKPSKTTPVDLVPRLRAAGIPIPNEEECEKEDAQPALTIELSRPNMTKAYNRRAGTEYVFGIRVRNLSYGSVQIQRFEVKMEWPSDLILLSDPRLQCPDTLVYRLESGMKFLCAEVLNHRLRERGTIQPGETLEGLLLAADWRTPIPSTYIHGDRVEATIRAIDLHGFKHTSYIDVLVDRRATMPPLRLTRPRPGLFEREPNQVAPAQQEPERTSESSAGKAAGTDATVPGRVRRGLIV